MEEINSVFLSCKKHGECNKMNYKLKINELRGSDDPKYDTKMAEELKIACNKNCADYESL
ncbi:hypothetical protein ACFL52_04720 [Candidatus Margulisiibacteriota bacterium]